MRLVAIISIGIASPYLLAQNNPTAPVAQAMQDAAQKFISTLDEAGRAKAILSFDDPKRLDWHNIPKLVRKGIQLRDMTPAQVEACHELLRAALSETGYEKAVRIMALENNLREGEKKLVGGHLRDPLRYFLSIFGQPDTSGSWGWSFEGHHFSLNFTIVDGVVVADSPSFWGANPATVRIFVDGGPAVGVRTLADEEQSALDLVTSLTDQQRMRALIDQKAPDDYRAAGLPQPPPFEATGLAVADMTADQQKQLQRVLQTYADHLAPALAARRMSTLHNDGLDKSFFAWAGATRPGVGHYYRVQGPSFLLELVNIQSDPAGNPANHIHSVWRDPRGDFGIAANRQ